MKLFALACLPIALASAHAQAQPDAYSSCDLAEQRSIAGDLGDKIRDPRQAHISMRTNILQADIGTARKARRVSQALADQLWQEVQRVRTDADTYTQKQGFLSAAERASYDRELDAVALKICPGRPASGANPSGKG